ncbi:MAG: ArsS family sensor histidine kinase [Campylobacterota bacterium]|nr:ArsS family sensor histidine kinase [Campylobacterota bacterium]
MKNLSVTTFIHILFMLAIVILLATFLFFVSWNKDRQKIAEINHYKLIADAFLSNVQLNPTEEKLEKFYKDFSVKPIPADQAKKDITKHGTTVFGGKSIYGQVRVFEIEEQHYIYVQRLGYNLMLEDARPRHYTFEIALMVGILLTSLLLLLYLAILKKLYPLKRLHREIEQFAAGDMDVKISYSYDDEIGKIAKNFDDAIIHIKELIASKNLFMRNMMHELKTPITKGRIVVESIDDEMVRGILVRAFERMNELINELAQVERVTTRNFEPIVESTSLQEVVEKSRHLLMAEKGRVVVEINTIVLHTDIKLLSLAIKNLLDNGIKYSKDRHVLLRTVGDKRIEIVSRGEPLNHPLSYYTEPFSQEEKRSSGFGLGLYIVHSILKKLGCGFDYQHIDDENIFTIVIGKRCC